MEKLRNCMPLNMYRLIAEENVQYWSVLIEIWKKYPICRILCFHRNRGENDKYKSELEDYHKT